MYVHGVSDVMEVACMYMVCRMSWRLHVCTWCVGCHGGCMYVHGVSDVMEVASMYMVCRMSWRLHECT